MGAGEEEELRTDPPSPLPSPCLLPTQLYLGSRGALQAAGGRHHSSLLDTDGLSFRCFSPGSRPKLHIHLVLTILLRNKLKKQRPTENDQGQERDQEPGY